MLLDCPPSLGVLTVAALTAATGVLIPLQCETLSHRGVGQLLDTVHDVRRFTNRDLQVWGVLPTLFDGRTNHARAVLDNISEAYSLDVVEPPIPKSIRFAEAPAAGQSILTHDPQAPRGRRLPRGGRQPHGQAEGRIGLMTSAVTVRRGRVLAAGSAALVTGTAVVGALIGVGGPTQQRRLRRCAAVDRDDADRRRQRRGRRRRRPTRTPRSWRPVRSRCSATSRSSPYRRTAGPGVASCST